MTYQPTKDNVFLLIEKTERVSSGGIFLPDTGNSEFGPGLDAARVIAAGPGGYGKEGEHGKLRHWPMEVCQGDRVLINHNAGEVCVVGEDIETGGMPHLKLGAQVRIVRCAEIHAVIE